jgi:hypothetical protein
MLLPADGTTAAQEIGIDMTAPTGQGTPSDYIYLVVHENTPKVHNVIVCTLCSCYPRWVLGMEPAWYKSFNYRRRMVRWPRQVLAEFGTIIPDDVEVRVHDSNQKTRYMVMPPAPKRHGRLDGRAARRYRHPRHDDRRGGPDHRRRRYRSARLIDGPAVGRRRHGIIRMDTFNADLVYPLAYVRRRYGRRRRASRAGCCDSQSAGGVVWSSRFRSRSLLAVPR